MRVKINVKGIVQGVGFRPFVYRIAVKNGLRGYVKNRGDAGVEILLEGQEANIRKFLKDLEEKKPPMAQIYETASLNLQGKGEYESFTINRSSGEVEHSGSVIPADIAICNECLQELRRPEDRRHGYFFITCTNCGPRYTIIDHVPYDRENTTMRGFKMCSFCRRQYSNPLDRRFHAQTVACPECGPKVYLTTREGKPIESDDPIRQAGMLLQEGSIIAIKGYGGFHIATAATKDEPLAQLRQVKHRSQKPFAIMARNVETIKSFAEISKAEEDLLTCYSRPIVLLEKRDDYFLSGLIAPRLRNLGVMLPYTGLHYMLFDQVDEPAFVMTSANPPSQPIITDNKEALTVLQGTVDYFLFHDRQIAQRCDDSVIRMHGNHAIFIRRSRGYAPTPIVLRKRAKRCVAGLGGELNNTACVLLEEKVFISQHIGDVENIETKSFLENAVKHLIHLTNSNVEVIACDLHPKFTTTKLARDLAEENGWRLIPVQHHHSHIAGLMAEHNVDEIIGICCDGYGYGSDGEAWGGEILFCARESFGFKRVAHLKKQPLIGSDLATRYPLRIAAGILWKEIDIGEWLLHHKQHFEHGEREIRILIHQLESGGKTVGTTSCGRVLDAVAAILGVCYERTYEGEPAMKLESVAAKGSDVLKLEPVLKGDTLDTSQMLLQVFENRYKHSTRDLAYSAHVYLAKGLARLAVEKALESNVKTIGFSGGVACNEILTAHMRRIVEDASLQFLVHEAVPPGDGGVSFGQSVAVGFPKF